MCPDAKGSLVVRSASSCKGQHKSVTRGTKVLYCGIGRVAVVTRGSGCRGEVRPADLRETGSRRDCE